MYSRMIWILSISIIIVFIDNPFIVWLQRTSLDDAFAKVYRPLRLWSFQLIGRTGEDPKLLKIMNSLNKTQASCPRLRNITQLCGGRNGPGGRSEARPTSVHRLRPGDIDIIGGLGDSITAGNGIFASGLLHLFVENRGMSFTIGGNGTWRQYLTIPNILKEFNPNLYGYSTRDGLSTDRHSKFNVGELGAMSRDMPRQSKVLVKRMQRDPHVNMTHDWKLITMFISNNDFCSDICYYSEPELVVQWHEQNMLKTYRYLRDNVPRLMLNVVPPPNLRFITRVAGLPTYCYATLRLECPCVAGRNDKHLDYYENIMKLWIAKDYEIAARNEFNTEDFTINIQPFTKFKDLFRTTNGLTDQNVLSYDCFHYSQLGHAIAANGLWNNMWQLPEEKTEWNHFLFKTFLCPSEKRPYLMTRVNSRKDFVL